jgi:hypothetical protein
MVELWFEPYLLDALRTVARDEIVAVRASGALRHRTRDLPERLFSALFILRRDGHIRLATESSPSDGWIPARLTSSGANLLEFWTVYSRLERQAEAASPLSGYWRPPRRADGEAGYGPHPDRKRHPPSTHSLES